MKDKIKTKLNILLLVFMLSLTGCKTENQERKIANLNYEEMLNENTSQISIDNVIYTNNYEEYKNYLSNLNPSYDLLRKTVKENDNITENNKESIIEIINLFEEKNIDSKNLAILYENLKIMVVTNENTDFYSLLQEIIKSSMEAQITYEDKIVYITSCDFVKMKNDLGEDIVTTLGLGFIEVKKDFICRYLTNNSSNKINKQKNYNNTLDIISFFLETTGTDFNTFFSYNVIDFKSILIALGIPEDEVLKIIKSLDNEITNISPKEYNTRELFYNNYIPKLVKFYLNSGLTSKEIYNIIGNTLKNSTIESIRDIDATNYNNNYLNEQKTLFDNIDILISNTLKEDNKETYSLQDFIGHEFKIYYSLYGEYCSLDLGTLYLSFNWDNTASNNANILIYVEDNKLKMCNYIENEDHSLTCYNYDKPLDGDKYGMKLSELIASEIMTVHEGYLKYYYNKENIIGLLKSNKLNCNYQTETLINDENTYLYINGSKATICNITINELGEEIPYYISNGKVYILKENALNVGSLKELTNERVITIDEYGNIIINNEELYSN